MSILRSIKSKRVVRAISAYYSGRIKYFPFNQNEVKQARQWYEEKDQATDRSLVERMRTLERVLVE